MLHFRRFARIEVPDVALTIDRPPSGATARPVLNLSEAGMLVGGVDLPVGQEIAFTLDAPDLHAGGRGHVAHRTGTATGVAVDHWDVPISDVRALLDPQFDTGELYVAEWA